MREAKDATERMTGDALKQFEVAEKRIDEAIDNARDFHIIVDLGGMTLGEKVRLKLSDAYKANGWKVNWQDGDQRDPGPFFKLST